MLVFLITVLNLLMMFWPEDEAIQNKVARVGLLFIVLLWKVILFGISDYQWKFYLGAVVLIAVLEFILPIFTDRDKDSYYDKLKGDEMRESTPRSLTLLGRINTQLGGNKFATAFLLILGIMFARDAGHSNALRKKEFLVYGISSDIAVLRIYDDLMICAQFDKVTKEVKSKFVFRRVADEPNLMFINESIGPLKPSE